MAKVLNMFRSFTMEHIDGYSNLSEWQKDLFDTIYKKHIASLPFDERNEYTEECIKCVEAEVSIIKVYFKNGERFLYLPEKTWVKIP